jgi:hypothetical protein
MIDRQIGQVMWRGGYAIAAVQLHPADVDLPEGSFVGSAADRVVNSEPTRFRHSPRLHEFAADAILEVRLALNHEHSRAGFRHRDSHGGAAEPPTYGDDIVLRTAHCDSSIMASYSMRRNRKAPRR